MDDGTQATLTQMETNARLAAALMAASGQVESALLASKRYSVADLEALNGASVQYLKQLVADLAFYKLLTARAV